MGTPPILANKNASAASVFTPAALLREARRQKAWKRLTRRRFAFWIPMAIWFGGCGRQALRPHS